MDMGINPQLPPTEEAYQPPCSSPSRYVLKEGDSFLVADAYGDVTGDSDGLFRNDTRVLSRLDLYLGRRRPSLLSGTVSQDNLFFTAHLTNAPLPSLGDSPTPEGVVHLERKRFLWQNRVYERIGIVNYGDRPTRAPLALHFDADFRDMFEVRGRRRTQRGEQLAAQVHARGVELRYNGLDGVVRSVCIDFSETPRCIDAHRAEFEIELGACCCWELYLEIGPETGAPAREAYRRAAACARRSLRARRRRGARLSVSGRLFQGWLDKSRADLALLTTDLPTGPYPYAGIPWFSTPFGRDAVVTSLQTLWLDPALSRGVLAFLARHQAQETSTFRDAEPGKIMHEIRKGEMAAVNELPFGEYYGGVDTTPLFVVLAGAYARRTADKAFIDELWPALVAAIRWVERHSAGNPDGFLDYARGEKSGLANQGWKDSHDSVFHADGRMAEGPIALVEVQGYVYRAYRSMAELAEWRGESQAAEHWRNCAQRLREAVERRFWLEDLQFYALALDGEGQPCRVRSSNVGHLLFTGLPSRERAQKVASQLGSRAFNSGWGIRTIATESSRYNPMSYHNGSVWPHDVALCVAGLARYGQGDIAVRLTDEMFEAAVHFGMRLPELFCGFERATGEAPIAYPVACLPQAWASGSVFMLLQACLGIQLDARHHRILIERPGLPAGVGHLRLQGLRMGQQQLDLVFQRIGTRVVAFVEKQQGPRAIQVDMRL
jgi:glycogen debranching enzyme